MPHTADPGAIDQKVGIQSGPQLRRGINRVRERSSFHDERATAESRNDIAQVRQPKRFDDRGVQSPLAKRSDSAEAKNEGQHPMRVERMRFVLVDRLRP